MENLHSPAHQQESRTRRSALSQTILIGEHIPWRRKALERLFRTYRARITFTTSGREAVETALLALSSGTPFDIILLDLDLPELDGFSAASLLRENRYLLPIISFGGSDFYLDEIESAEVGIDEHVPESSVQAHLVEVVRRCTRMG